MAIRPPCHCEERKRRGNPVRFPPCRGDSHGPVGPRNDRKKLVIARSASDVAIPGKKENRAKNMGAFPLRKNKERNEKNEHEI